MVVTLIFIFKNSLLRPLNMPKVYITHTFGRDLRTSPEFECQPVSVELVTDPGRNLAQLI